MLGFICFIMEKALDENSKMGVDQVKTILSANTQTVGKDGVRNRINFSGLREPEILATKAMLDSVFQSTKDTAKILKRTQKEGCAKRSGSDKKKDSVKENTLTSINGSMARKIAQNDLTSSELGISKRDTITLTLEAVSQPPRTSVSLEKSNYSKVECNNLFRTSGVVGRSPNTKAIAVSSNESAVKKFQEWHAKHVTELAYASSMNSATSKLRAIAAKAHCHEPTVVPGITAHSQMGSICTTNGNAASENANNMKRKYFTISSNYFQYLNQPKRARHSIHQVVFKEEVPPESDASSKQQTSVVFPSKFIAYPSGKTPLPGYKGKRRWNRIASFIPKKKRRTIATYRVPKPKPKLDLHAGKVAFHSVVRKPMLQAVKKPRFFPTDKLRWDSVARRYVVQSHQAASQAVRGQWFSFPSASKVHGSFSLNCAAVKKKFGISGTTISPSFGPTFPQTQNRTIPPPIKIQHVVKDINAILKCLKPPKPRCFKKYEDYSATCFLFQVRKFMAARTMRFGYVEGTATGGKEENEECQAPVKRPVSHRLVLISTPTETTLAMWSSHLPRAKELDKVVIDLTQSSASSDALHDHKWVHICQGDVVEHPPCEIEDQQSSTHSDHEIFKQASVAWLRDSFSDHDGSSDEESNNEVTRCTGGPSLAPVSEVDLGSIHTKSPPKWGDDNLCMDTADPENHKPVCSGQARMQRSLSQARNLDQQQNEIQKKVRSLPQPSYCVRYRMCFCRLHCTCNANNAWPDRTFSVNSPLSNTPQFMCHEDRARNVTSRRNDSSYDFSEQSDVPSIVLKSSKWDARKKRFRSKSAVEFESNSNSYVELPNGLGRKGKLVKKIGATEIYHKWAVRRFSAPESKCDSVVENMYPRGSVERIGWTADSGRGLERMLKASGGYKKDTTLTWQAEKPHCQEDDMETLFEVVEEVVIDAKRCENFDSNHRTRRVDMSNVGTVSHVFSHSEKPPCTECMYTMSKQFLSKIAAYEREVVCFPLTEDVSGNSTAEKHECSGLSSSLSVRNHGRRDMLDKRIRHLSNPIGRSHSKQKHVSAMPDEHSLKVGSVSAEDATHLKDHSSQADEDSMGNRLRKANRQRWNSPVLKSDVVKACDTPPDREKKMAPVLANGLFKETEHVRTGDVTPSLYDRERKSADKCNGSLDSDGSGIGKPDTEGSASVEPKRGPFRQSEATSCVRDGTERKTRSMSRVSSDNASKTDTVPNGKQSKSDCVDCIESVECTDKALLPKSKVGDYVIGTVSIENTVSKEQLASGVTELDLPVETRSSRRLRSRVNNKRGRYETDYVSDLPKANKKPKRILPTRDYDNDDFWQFYRDNEKTVYSKNLILQSKYIKLLKKKGIKCSLAGSQSALFSNVVCASSSTPCVSLPTIPDDGLMPFIKRLTKPRKTAQELPTVADGHCAYCGRSFVGTDKQVLDSHLARHGIRYTMLTAPQALKKKKKPMKNGRRDLIYKRRKSASNKTNTVAEMSERKPQSAVNSVTSSVAEEPNSFEPLPKPSHLAMGHRKQTARKSFSLASTLPKDMLIAALECRMRAQSTITSEKTTATGKPGGAEQQSSPTKKQQSPLSPSAQSRSDDCFIEPLPKPHSARKTLTGLPITYNHLNRSYIQAISYSTKSSR